MSLTASEGPRGIVGRSHGMDRQQDLLHDVLNITFAEEPSPCPHELPDPRRDRSQQDDVGIAVALLGTRHETAQVLVRRWGLIHQTAIVTFPPPPPNTPLAADVGCPVVDRRRRNSLEVRMNTRYLVASALAAAIVAPVALSAQKPVPPPTAFKTEKCYGIAKAGKNDCASTGNNSCGGSSKLNSDPKAWIYVPAGYCDRIVGGSVQPK